MTVAAKNHPLNCGVATSSFSRTFQKRTLADRKFDLTANEVKRVTVSGSQETVVYNKTGSLGGTPLKAFTRASTAGYETDFLATLSVRSENYFQKITYSSANPSVLAVNPVTGEATYQSSGQCTILATSEDGEVSAARVSVTSVPAGATVETFSGWAAGTLAAHCVGQINSLTAGKTELNVFTVANGTSFVRNQNCWANGVDLSCASPWNSFGGSQRAGTLISPRHVLFCAHASFFPSAGSTIWFVSKSGSVITRTIQGISPVQSADFVVGVLDSDVSAGVTFSRVLPNTWANYLPGIDSYCRVPAIALNQTDRASIHDLVSLSRVYIAKPPREHAAYSGDIIVGDSGNPVFLVVDGSPVLVGVWTTPYSGSFTSHFTGEINAAMASLGGGYQLTHPPLAAFASH